MSHACCIVFAVILVCYVIIAASSIIMAVISLKEYKKRRDVPELPEGFAKGSTANETAEFRAMISPD